MSEDGSDQEYTTECPSQASCALSPPNPRGDLTLRHTCQCFEVALNKFAALRRETAGDLECGSPSEAAQLAEARSRLCAIIAELTRQQATSWGGYRAKYDAWMRLMDEFGQQDTRVCALAIALLQDTDSLFRKYADPLTHGQMDWGSVGTATRQDRTSFLTLLSRVGALLPVFTLRGRRSQT